MPAHPDHDAVSRQVRSWYTASTPEIGMTVTPVSYGYLTDSDRPDLFRVILTVDSPDQVEPALGAASVHYAGVPFEVWVNDPSRAGRLDAALTAAGLAPVQDTVVLALVGSIRAEAGPADLDVEEVGNEEVLRIWASVKIRGFGDTEDLPPEADVAREVANRAAEWPVSRYLLGVLEDEPVAILGHYTGDDQMVFLLATRTPYRDRGIAQAMLGRLSVRARSEGARSLLINCDDGGPAWALYRRIGFSDEVYWHRRYRWRS